MCAPKWYIWQLPLWERATTEPAQPGVCLSVRPQGKSPCILGLAAILVPPVGALWRITLNQLNKWGQVWSFLSLLLPTSLPSAMLDLCGMAHQKKANKMYEYSHPSVWHFQPGWEKEDSVTSMEAWPCKISSKGFQWAEMLRSAAKPGSLLCSHTWLAELENISDVLIAFLFRINFPPSVSPPLFCIFWLSYTTFNGDRTVQFSRCSLMFLVMLYLLWWSETPKSPLHLFGTCDLLSCFSLASTYIRSFEHT